MKNGLNCYDIQAAYNKMTEKWCSHLFSGYIEMVVLYVACLPLNAILTLLGVRFCVRNKVDVPTVKQLALENPHMKIDVIKEENTDEKNKDTDENGEA